MHSKNNAIKLALLMSIIWGFSYYFTGSILDEFGPATITLIRFLIAIIPAIIINLRKKVPFFVERKDLKKMILASIFGGGVYYYLSTTSANLLSNSQSITISSLQLIIVLIIYNFIDETLIRPKSIVAVGLCSIGAILSSRIVDFRMNVLGTLLFLVATIMWVIYMFIIRDLLKKYDIRTVLLNGYFFSIFMVAPISLFEDNNFLALIPNLEYFIYLGVFCITIGYYINAVLIRDVGISYASVFISINPLWFFLVDTLYFNLPVKLINLVGIIFILFGALLILEDVFKSEMKEYRRPKS